MSIKQENGSYVVKSEEGKHMGTYASLLDAQKRLREIEYFKHKKSG